MDEPPLLSRLSFESVLTRRYVVASYWLVVLFALPLWWSTTSIDRLSLPASRVHAQQRRNVIFPVHIHVNSTAISDVAPFIQEVQQRLKADTYTLQSSGIDARVSDRRLDSSAYDVVLSRGSRDPTVQDRRLFFDIYPEEDGLSWMTSVMRLTDTVTQLLAPYSTYSASTVRELRVMKYSPRYRLAFTLLNEDAASGNAAMSWNIKESISSETYFSILDRLSVLHNFTVESQVQFHAPLAFDPRTLRVNGTEEHGLTQEDLTVFINSAEWTLSSSVSNDPVIHFVLFVPSSSHSPLHILDYDGLRSRSNAFMLPQWGGIVLLDKSSSSHLTASDLDPAFTIFRYQLSTLLGLPDFRFACSRTKRASSQIGSSMRYCADAHWKTWRGVQKRWRASWAHAAASSSVAVALRHSSRALSLSSRAFFNPGMLALLYFPAEHKYAVYTPLFASIAAPLVAAVVREVLAWRRSRKQRRAEKIADARPVEPERRKVD
ncbi:GPI transamidase component PIG-S [Grifola frondosa]|uniref:GPI transamidase component PIG-S n=1 Tax=Grifola frondosa TaxID=5627 RepID=A0A1C7LSB8_GRIFR|nr:GPI transamidase component PIG-S [Grifola frondosa]